MAPDGQLIENIYLIQRTPDAETKEHLQREVLIDVGSAHAIRVKLICADRFDWIFDAFKADASLEAVNPKLLRALMARTFSLVRHDIPTKTVEVNYEKLEHALSSDSEFAKLYGITTLDDPSAVNAMYPYSLTQVNDALGYKGWHRANQLINQIGEETGVYLKQSDNKYHVAFLAGTKSQMHKYSEATVDILRLVDEGEEYSIEP